MSKETKKYISIGFALLGIAVILGAFGSHALQDSLSEKYFNTFKTANLYHYIHAIGIVICAIALGKHPKLRVIFVLFLIGLVCFSGSLYILSLNELLDMPQLKLLGAVAPIGGLSFILAWFWAAKAMLTD
jgi:uncharacterized membrane protein YgdD (TMEM256/DUF423 family)